MLAPLVGAWPIVVAQGAADGVDECASSWLARCALCRRLASAGGVPGHRLRRSGLRAGQVRPGDRVGRPARLVAANAWIEVSVVGAVLLGTAAGGFLVSAVFSATPAALLVSPGAVRHGWRRQAGLAPASAVVLGLAMRGRGCSTCACAVAPRADPGRRPQRFTPCAVARILHCQPHAVARSAAAADCRWRSRRCSGARAPCCSSPCCAGPPIGSACSLAGAAYLQAAVAVGLIAGRLVGRPSHQPAAAPRVSGRRAVLGLLVAFGPWLNRSRSAAALLIAVGLVGGLLMVPMNALLQHRGCQLLSAGRSIAVQGFNENVSVLAMLAAYAATVRLEVPIAPLMTASAWRWPPRWPCSRGRCAARATPPAALAAATLRCSKAATTAGSESARRATACRSTDFEVVDHAPPVERERAVAEPARPPPAASRGHAA